MTYHQLITLLFLVLPVTALFFNKYFLIRKNLIKEDGKCCRIYVMTAASMIVFYNIYFIVNFVGE